MSTTALFNRHKLYSRLNRKLVRVLLSVVAIAGVIAVGQLAFRASTSSRAAQSAPQKTAVVPTQQVRFTIYPEGIHPATATVTKGVLSIAIEDLADANGGVLIERISDHGRQAVGNVHRFENHWRGRASVELSPGVYELRVPDKSITPAQLIVEP
jgi:hypothetical protein